MPVLKQPKRKHEDLRLRLGAAMKRERLLRSMRQDDVAQRVGLTLAAIGRIERGVGAISLDLLASIAEVFRLTPVELLARAESAPPQGTARPLLRGRHVYTRLRTDAGTVINLHPTRMNANLVRQLDLSERRES